MAFSSKSENSVADFRIIFDLCDTEKQGFISVQRFQEMAKKVFVLGEYVYDAEELQRIQQLLDPAGDGRIHFEDFCKGVKRIMGRDRASSPSLPISSSSYEEQSVQNEELSGKNEEQPVQNEELSELYEEHSELYTKEKQEGSEDAKGGESNMSAISALGMPQSSSSYGVDDADNKDYATFSTIPHSMDEHRTSTPCAMRLFDVIPQKQVYSFEDFGLGTESSTTTPLGNSQNGFNTSSAVAAASRSHRRRSSGHKQVEFCDADTDGSITELTDRIHLLENHLSDLSQKQVKTDEKHGRLKEENSYLVERVHILEEQLIEKEQVEGKQRGQQAALIRLDKEKSQEIENLSQSFIDIDEECCSLRKEVPKLREDNNRLRKECRELEDLLHQTQNNMNAQADEYAKCKTCLVQEKENLENDRLEVLKQMDELRHNLKELQELQEFRQEEQDPAVQLRQKSSLQECTDEQETLISKSVWEERTVDDQAALIHELQEKLKQSEAYNQRLHQHVNELTIKVLALNPQLLEKPLSFSQQ